MSNKGPLTTDPETVARNALRVSNQHDDYERAEEVEEGAYVELLDAILVAATPALLAISSVIPNSDLRGILLVTGEREEIWWLEASDLVCIRAGSRPQPIHPREIVERYGRGAVVDAIMRVSVAIDAQLRGGKSAANEKIRRRADQIKALATLARGLS